MYDYIIIGGGIIGLSTAFQLQQRYPDHKILVLEKEAELAQHQTGHNSGVVHSGVYYRPGSLKARFCQSGAAAIKQYCERRGLPFKQPGKLIVATKAAELARLRGLFELSKTHGLASKWLTADALTSHESNIRGLAAIFIASAAIVDYRSIANSFAVDFRALGGTVRTGVAARGLHENSREVRVVSDHGEFSSRYLIACGGLQSDRLARQLGLKPGFRIIPVRGEYYQLPADRQTLVRHLVYPVPVPGVPFLGVHITPMIDGRLTLGPNAVFAWRRESQSRRDRWQDVRDSLAFPGFWRMGTKYWRFALNETFNSLCKRGHLRAARKYCPQLTLRDLQPYPPGVRAQAVAKDGSLIDDFLFAESARTLHVCNAPSPAATSAIPIGAFLCDKLTESERY